MAAEEEKYILGKQGERRMKGRTITVPVVTGTCAFYLGKKVRIRCQWRAQMRLRGPQRLRPVPAKPRRQCPLPKHNAGVAVA